MAADELLDFFVQDANELLGSLEQGSPCVLWHLRGIHAEHGPVHDELLQPPLVGQSPGEHPAPVSEQAG